MRIDRRSARSVCEESSEWTTATTRLTVPLAPPRATAMSVAFGVDQQVLEGRWEISARPLPAAPIRR
jgi:hypothetical protein